MTAEQDDVDPDLGDLYRAVRTVAGYRPGFVAVIVLLSVFTAFLSGIGVGFILPIVELAQSSNTANADGLMSLFVRAYALVGLPLTLATAVGGVALVMVARHTTEFLSKYLRAKLRMGLVRDIRIRGFENAIDARVDYYDEHGSDEVLNAIVTQSGYAGGFITNGTNFLQAVLVSLVYVAVAFYLAPQLTLLTAAVLAVLAVVVRLVFGSGYEAGDAVARANERVQETVQQGTQGIREVKLFGLGREMVQEVADAVQFHRDAVVRLRRNRAAFGQLYQLVSALTVFVLLYLGLAVFEVPLSELAAFLFTMFRLAPQVTRINDVFYRAEGDMPHVVRSMEFVEELERSAEPTDGAAALPDRVDHIEFDDVSFSYDGDEQVLEGVSFAVDRPEFVALVGQSGAGKSTVVSLLARLYAPDEGEISADGTAIDEFDVREWRSRVSVVRQNPHIFNDTLRFNLTVGNRDATDAELDRVCEIAQVTEFMDDLPAGYDTDLGDDGVRLSGGQRQRVAIARALLKDADVLLLDEATSDLDTGLEERVHRAIERMDRDFATVAIAHRLSTVINADRIHVFDDGEIVETGTHEELLDHAGIYADLYDVQTRSVEATGLD